jgi:HTH-type transcriptional regulator/antitoxin HigA
MSTFVAFGHADIFGSDATEPKEIQSDVFLHPGEVLLDELEARNIKKTDFAKSMNMKPGHFSELLHGKKM